MGLKEQVKQGKMTAKQALEWAMANHQPNFWQSKTASWLTQRLKHRQALMLRG